MNAGLFSVWLNDVPTPIEVKDNATNEVLFRNMAMRAAFPIATCQEDTPFLTLVQESEVSLGDDFIVTSHRLVDMFSSWDNVEAPDWTPDYTVEQRALAGVDATGGRHRFFQYQQVEIEGDPGDEAGERGYTLLVLSDQTRHWRVERELAASIEGATSILYMIEKRFPGLGAADQAMDRVNGDFVYGDTLLATENATKSVFVVGDCSGHGMDAAVLRMLLVTHLEHEIEQYTTRRKNKLPDKQSAPNPFDAEGRQDYDPAGYLLGSMHSRLESYESDPRKLGIHGFDGAVVVADVTAEARIIHAALTKFDLFHLQIEAGVVRDIQVHKARRIAEMDEGLAKSIGMRSELYKGAGGQAEWALLLDKVEFQMGPEDLLFLASDGFKRHLTQHDAESDFMDESRDPKVFLRRIVAKYGPDPQALADHAMLAIRDSRPTGAPWLDDVIVCFFSPCQAEARLAWE